MKQGLTENLNHVWVVDEKNNHVICKICGVLKISCSLVHPNDVIRKCKGKDGFE